MLEGVCISLHFVYLQGIQQQQEEAVLAHESWQEAADDMSCIITAVEEGLSQTVVTPSDVQELQAKTECLQVRRNVSVS